MKTRNIIAKIIIGIALVTLQANLVGQTFNKGGRTGMQFLKIGVGARQIGLGEACTASSSDINSVFWNPANISTIDRLESSFSYTKWFADLNYLSGAVGFKLRKLGVLGIGLSLLDYGELEEATVFGDARTGNTFSGSDTQLILAFSRMFTERLSIGISLKYFSETLHEYDVSTINYDVGTRYETGYKGFVIGFSAQNFKSETIKWLDEGDSYEGYEIPLFFRIGTAFNLIDPVDGILSVGNGQRVLVAFDAINTNDYGERYHLGAEYSYRDMLFFRSGYKFNYKEGNFTAGVGLKTRKFQLDYSFTGYEYLESPQRVSLIYSL